MTRVFSKLGKRLTANTSQFSKLHPHGWLTIRFNHQGIDPSRLVSLLGRLMWSSSHYVTKIYWGMWGGALEKRANMVAKTSIFVGK